MKTLKLIVLLLPLSFFLLACPIGLDYPADEEGKNPIDKKLTGVWKCTKSDHEIAKLEISKKDKSAYEITVIEKGSLYGIEANKLTAWVTTIDNYKIIYAKPENEKKYYHYVYEVNKDNTLTTWDIVLLEGGVNAVTSTQSLREQIKASSKTEGFLSSETTYKKE